MIEKYLNRIINKYNKVSFASKKAAKLQLKRTPMIFVKTPKTGSTSIQHLLHKHRSWLFMNELMNKPGFDLRREKLSNNIIGVGAYKSRIQFQEEYPDIWEQAYKFSVVRNPYSKALSSWRYCPSTKDKSLVEALSNPPKEEENFHDYLHFTMTQTSLLSKDGKIYVDELLRYENLNDQWRNFCDKHEIAAGDLPTLNKSTRKKAKKELTSEEIRLINELFTEDFHTFGYKMLQP